MYPGIRNEYVTRQDWASVKPDERFWLHWGEQEDFLLHLCTGWLQGTELDAREVLSSAMLKAWDGAVNPKSEIGNYKAWLAKIVRHHCIDQLRKWNRDRKVNADPEQLVPMTEKQPAGQVASPEWGMLKEESYQGLLARMETLPKRLREVMMLRAYQNMSFKEIGLHLHITAENARKRVQSARDMLREEKQEAALVQGSSEGDAANAILGADRQISQAARRFAVPVAFQCNGLAFELPVFHPHRPLRLGQKVETLRRYVQLHPGGWRKELELGTLCWALGDAAAARTHIAAAWERQPQMPELALTYLDILHALGDDPATQEVARHLMDLDCATSLQCMARGFHAAAHGDLQLAIDAWGRSGLQMGQLLQARTLIAAGRHDQASTRLQAHVTSNPMDREGYFWLMEAQPSDALQFTTLAVRRFPGDPYAQAHHLAARLVAGGHGADAIDTEWEAFLKSQAGTFLALATKVVRHASRGERPLALDAIMAFLQQHPRHLQALELASRWCECSGLAAPEDFAGRRRELILQAAFAPRCNGGLMSNYWRLPESR